MKVREFPWSFLDQTSNSWHIQAQGQGSFLIWWYA